MRFVEPTVVSSHFHLREGDVVADFGAGRGYFLRPLSEAVGDSGLVYACEIQKSLVEALGTTAQQEGLRNIHAIWCDLEKAGGSKLETAAVDCVVLINTFFQVEHKKVVVLEIARVLRHGGKVIIIDWTESWSGMGPHPDEVMVESATRALFEEAGFTFETSFDAGDHHYGITLRT